jgi:hypothetical protein
MLSHGECVYQEGTFTGHHTIPASATGSEFVATVEVGIQKSAEGDNSTPREGYSVPLSNGSQDHRLYWSSTHVFQNSGASKVFVRF